LSILNQILVKDGALFSKIKQVDTVLFDKTGTLTGKYNVIHVERMVSTDYDNLTFWEVTKHMEHRFISHPIAQILYQEALREIQASPAKAKMKTRVCIADEDDIEYIPSEGIACTSVQVNNQTHKVLIGNTNLLKKHNIPSTATIEEEVINSLANKIPVDQLHDCIKIWVCIDDIPQFLIMLDNENSIRPNAQALIKTLQTDLKKNVYLVTGDIKASALSTGYSLGIKSDCIYYEMKPTMKEELVTKLQSEGKKVMMIGDGLNDLKAYLASDISVAINYKTSKNLSTAQVIILNNQLMNLLSLFKLSEWSEKIKFINLGVSFCYNIVAIPFAAGVFYVALGYDLPPSQACWAMALSSIAVILISLSLKCVNFNPVKGERRNGGYMPVNVNSKDNSPFVEDGIMLESDFMDPQKGMRTSEKLKLVVV